MKANKITIVKIWAVNILKMWLSFFNLSGVYCWY